jgi:hypothetical protein
MRRVTLAAVRFANFRRGAVTGESRDPEIRRKPDGWCDPPDASGPPLLRSPAVSLHPPPAAQRKGPPGESGPSEFTRVDEWPRAVALITKERSQCP